MRVTNLLSSAVKCLRLQGGFAPLDPAGGTAPRPHIGSRSRARHILSVPVLFLTGNETWVYPGPTWSVKGSFGSVRVRSGPVGSGRVRVVEFSYNFVHGTNAGNHYATPPTGGLKRAFGVGIVSPTSPSRRNLIPVTARVVNTHLGDLICVISPFCGVNQSTT